MKNFVFPGLVLVLAGNTPLFAAEVHSGCNQLGREIALRAAERMQVGLDAAARAELAHIAMQACMEFASPAVAAELPADSEQNVAAHDPADPDEATAAEPRRIFGLDIIPPEDRVRRPGLKRP